MRRPTAIAYISKLKNVREIEDLEKFLRLRPSYTTLNKYKLGYYARCILNFSEHNPWHKKELCRKLYFKAMDIKLFSYYGK